MKNIMKKFLKEEDGATIMEYILMIAVGAGIIALIFPFIKGKLAGFTNSATSGMEDGLVGTEMCTGELGDTATCKK